MTVFLKSAKEQRKYVEVRKRELEKERLDLIKSDIEYYSNEGKSSAIFDNVDLENLIITNLKMFTDLGYDVIFEVYEFLDFGVENRFIKQSRDEYDKSKEGLRRIVISWE